MNLEVQKWHVSANAGSFQLPPLSASLLPRQRSPDLDLPLMPSQQRRAVRVVLPAIAFDHPLVEIGIAVGAAETATVVGPHVNRFHAVAGLSLVFVLLCGGLSTEQLADQFAIDAGAVLNTKGAQIRLLAAGEDLQSVAVGDLPEASCKPLQLSSVFRGGDIFGPDSASLQSPVQPSFPLAVKIAETEHKPPCGLLQPVRGPGRLSQVPVHSCNVGEEHRVVAPDDPLRTDPCGQLNESGDAFAEGVLIRFQSVIVGIQGELEEVVQPQAVQLIQVLHERPGVLGPEADCVHVRRFQAETGDLSAVERVDPAEVPFPDPVHEPVGIKGRYVGASAGGNDQGLALPVAWQ